MQIADLSLSEQITFIKYLQPCAEIHLNPTPILRICSLKQILSEEINTTITFEIIGTDDFNLYSKCTKNKIFVSLFPRTFLKR